MKYLLDTTVIIEQMRDNKDVSLIILDEDSKLNLSACCLFEILSGFLKKESMLAFRNEFADYPVLPFTLTDSVRAADISISLSKKGKMVNVLDILIAAQALEHGLVVLTMDGDFEIIKSVHPELIVQRI